MKIFLTGGAGYIGSAAAASLLEAGHQVTVLDSLVTGHRSAVPDGAKFIEADLGDHQTVFEALKAEPYDAVMHFAAFIEAGESMQEPGNSSSAAVYDSSEELLTEEAPLKPGNPYGQTKLMVEGLLDWYRQTHGIGYAALRYFNAAGALPDRGEAHSPESHLIPLVLQVALDQRSEVRIFGTDYPTPDGTCIRDYIHLADLVSAHLLALEALEPESQMIYNVGNGSGYSVREVVDTARKVTGHALPAVETDRREGDPPRLVASSEKIRAELGWSPEHPDIEAIISSAWEWHQSHPEGYK
jgi:UDP-glucose 4-epimerase